MKPKDRETWVELEDEYSDFLRSNAEATTNDLGQRVDLNKIPENIIEAMTTSLYGF